MIPVLIRFSEEELDAIDSAVEEERQQTVENLSRNSWVRRACRKMLEPAEVWTDPPPMDDSPFE
jgi:hypothetical protein